MSFLRETEKSVLRRHTAAKETYNFAWAKREKPFESAWKLVISLDEMNECQNKSDQGIDHNMVRTFNYVLLQQIDNWLCNTLGDLQDLHTLLTCKSRTFRKFTSINDFNKFFFTHLPFSVAGTSSFLSLLYVHVMQKFSPAT